MPIEFRCTNCGKMLRTTEASAGRRAQCPACATVMTVPQGEPADPAPPQRPSFGNISSPPAPAAPEVPLGSPFTGGASAASETDDSANPYAAPSEFAGVYRPVPTMPSGGTHQGNDVRAVAACVLGISSVCMCCIPLFGLVIGLVGIGAGIVALKTPNAGMATVGIVLSAVGTVLAGLFTVAFGMGMMSGRAPWM